jgi:hypothetical protein
MSNYEIPTETGDLLVDEWSINACGVSGTLYHGDADLIGDYLANPTDELDIYGVLHHIHLAVEGDKFSLSIEFMGQVGKVTFGQSAARDFIFAMAFSRPRDPNPWR